MDTVVKMIDQEIVGMEKRLDALRSARDVLAPSPVRPKRTRRKRGTATSSRPKKASPAHVEKVKQTLIEVLNGRASQVAITKASNLPSGAVSAAVHALEEQGEIEKTGNKEGRSFEYALVGAPQRGEGEGEPGEGGEHGGQSQQQQPEWQG